MRPSPGDCSAPPSSTPTSPASTFARYLAARIAFVVDRNLVNPDVHAAVGIDPRVGRRAASANPHWQETIRWSARKVVPFLREQGIIGGVWEYLWRRAHLV